MKQPGTTKKHSGTAKHAPAKAKHTPAKKATKHTPAKQPAHHKAAPAHHATPHHPSTHNPKGPKQPAAKTRKLALSGAVACCSVEALAASLRLVGHPVSGSDVYRLYRAISRSDDAGATILATLKAASTFGLAGMRLADFRAVPVSSPHVVVGGELPGSHALYQERGRAWSWGAPLDLTGFPGWEPEEAWEVFWR